MIKYCSNCGAPLEEGARFCGECGAAVTDLQDSDESKFEQDQIEPGQGETERKDFDPPPPKLEKKIRQENSKTYSEDNSPSNNYGWLIVWMMLFLIIAGGAVYVYLERQSIAIVDTTKISSDLSKATSKSNSKKQQAPYIKITKQMLVDRVLYTERYSAYLEIRFLKSSFKSVDGDIVSIFLDNHSSIKGSMETTSYRLKDGRIIEYGNDGSKTRVTLISSTPDSWVTLEEDDGDGDDKRFGYAQPVKRIYYLKRPKEYPRFEDCKPNLEGACTLTPSKFLRE